MAKALDILDTVKETGYEIDRERVMSMNDAELDDLKMFISSVEK